MSVPVSQWCSPAPMQFLWNPTMTHGIPFALASSICPFVQSYRGVPTSYE